MASRQPRKAVYVAVFLDGSEPNKVYTRFENANRTHYGNDNVEIYRHKVLEDGDYTCVPNEDSSKQAKRYVSEEVKQRQSEYMKEHYRRYVYLAFNEATNEYRDFTRKQNCIIFCSSNPEYTPYLMLRTDWDEHGQLFNETAIDMSQT